MSSSPAAAVMLSRKDLLSCFACCSMMKNVFFLSSSRYFCRKMFVSMVRHDMPARKTHVVAVTVLSASNRALSPGSSVGSFILRHQALLLMHHEIMSRVSVLSRVLPLEFQQEVGVCCRPGMDISGIPIPCCCHLVF